MKFKELTRKIFSTKKGKAVFSVVIAAAVACGTVTGVTGSASGSRGSPRTAGRDRL